MTSNSGAVRAVPTRLARLTAPAKRIVGVAFLQDFAVAAMSLGIQFLGIKLDASTQMLGVLPAASAIAYTVGCVVSGQVSDRWGRRRPAMLSCFATGVIWLLMSRATSPLHLLVLYPMSGAALSLMWPAAQAWLGELCGDNSKRLSRTISLFNVFWSAGLMGGTLLAGWMWRWGVQWPFVIPALISFASMGILYLTPPGQRAGTVAPPTVTHVPFETTRLFLLLAWVGNFASWFLRATIGASFPKLGHTLGFPDTVISSLSSISTLALCLMFGLSRVTQRWQYHLRVLLFVEFTGIISMVIVWRALTPAMFALGFALCGLCCAVTYVSSLSYALHGTSANRGKRSGLHEAVLGLGIIVGPLVAGFLGEHLDLHAPFLACAVVIGLAMVAQVVIWCRAPRSVRSPGAAA